MKYKKNEMFKEGVKYNLPFRYSISIIIAAPNLPVISASITTEPMLNELPPPA